MDLKKLHPGNLSFRLKILISFFIVGVLPIAALGIAAYKTFDKIEEKAVKEIAAKGKKSISFASEIGDYAIDQAAEALDIKVIESVESRAVDLSNRIADFLYERDNDILMLSKNVPSADFYLNFYNTSNRDIIVEKEPPAHEEAPIDWLNPDNQRRWRHYPPFNFIKESIPLYKEITFVSLSGVEKIKISEGKISSDLKDISKKENTYCRAEDYFKDLAALKVNEIYVSRVVGPYVKGWLKFANGRVEVDKKSGYAGKENPEGDRFQGIIRFAAPVFQNGVKKGYVTFALDHTHLMEFTDHMVPTAKKYQAFPDAGNGDYAWMWDYKGRCISHPRHFFIAGFDPETGREVPWWVSEERYKEFEQSGKEFEQFFKDYPVYHNFSLKKKGSKKQLNQGLIPLDCRYLDHAPQCQGWHRNTSDGGFGSFVIFWSGLWKLTSEAAIPYYTGQYSTTKTGFGYVTFGADVRTFHKEAIETGFEINAKIDKVKSKIDKDIDSAGDLLKGYINNYKYFFTGLFCTAFFMIIFLCYIITKRVIGPVRAMKEVLKAIEQGDFSKRVKIDFRDELGELGSSFNMMANALAFSEIKQNEYLKRARNANSRLVEAIKKKSVVEKELITNKKNLEKIVEERTESLKKANQSLILSIKDLNIRKQAAVILAEMSEKLQKCSTRNEIYDIVGKACEKLFPRLSGGIFKFDSNKEELSPVYLWGEHNRSINIFPIEECPALKDLVCVRQKDENRRLCTHMKENPLRFFYCLPVWNQDEKIGVFSLSCSAQENTFSSKEYQEIEIDLTSLAEYFKAAYINVNLRNKLEKESLEDALTGLYNRRYMEITLKREVSRVKRYDFSIGIMMIDVDHFKSFNDKYGHETGDNVLAQIGKWLLENTRKEDVACRYGGEEFIIILPGMEMESLEEKAEFFCKQISETVHVSFLNKKIDVTVSIGIACMNKNDAGLDIISKADKALYKAKELGRNRVEIYKD